MPSIPPHHCPDHPWPLSSLTAPFDLGSLPFRPPQVRNSWRYSAHLASSLVSDLTAQPTAIWFHPHHATEITLVNVTSEDVRTADLGELAVGLVSSFLPQA